MTRVLKQTVVTDTNATVAPTKQVNDTHTVERLVYFLFGILELLLLFRLFFKFTGANPASSFVSFIYSLTSVFILPFEGIFRRAYTDGVETTSILEPSTVVALVVYAVLAWGVVQLIVILSRERESYS